MNESLGDAQRKHFAVLIDAENISSKYSAIIFDELEKYGYDAPCRRIYGNWSREKGWKEELLLEYSILPIQQFSYTNGKNSTDITMVIDAMDLLYQNKVDGFCLVTSDSDFTRLAMRLREEQKYVLGMGESKAPQALTRACDKFILLNLIDESNKEMLESEPQEEAALENVTSTETLEKAILAMLNESDEGELHLGEVGSRLAKKFPDFDSRNYGYSKLSVFLAEKMPHLEVRKERNQYLVRKEAQTDREEIEEAVRSIMMQKGGKVDNLAVIYEGLKKMYSGFDIKDYGYGRMSSFLRSVRGLSVSGNTVKLNESEKKFRRKR
ncbi:MAG: NYN domain-containing protein [Butyricicoccus sp.]